MSIVLDGTTGITTPGLTNTGTETIVNLTTSGNTILGDASTDTLNVGNGGLVKDASGNVGVGTGTSALAAKLNVQVGAVTTLGAQASSGLFISGGGSNNNLCQIALGYGTTYAPVAISSITTTQTGNTIADLIFATRSANTDTAPAERMRIDSSGNVGIGITPSGNYGLQTKASYSDGFIGFSLGSLTGGASGAGYPGIGYNVRFTSTSNSYLYNASDTSSLVTFTSGGIQFFTAASGTGGAAISSFSTAKMTLDSSGNLLVGATSSSAARLYVTADAALLDPVTIHNTNTTATSQYSILFVRNGTIRGSIQTTNAATSYLTSSDYRLKENVQPLTGAIAKVSALKPCTYNWKDGGSASEGFIAHELAEVCPNAVCGEKDAVNEDGSIKPQGIDTSFLVATLTAAIKEQQAIITQLQADVAALQAPQGTP